MSEKRLDKETQEFGGNDFGEGGEFGAETAGSYSVENGSKTISLNKQIKVMFADRLSALPDCLLIHILSFLGVEKAAITSVLGKRWQFLWAELPALEFRFEFWENSEKAKKIGDFVAWVHRTLIARRGNHLEKLKVNFKCDDDFSSDVNVWLGCALKNKVKQVALNLEFRDDFYTLPEMMYSSSSLTSLSLRGCILAPEIAIEWQSLTSLKISHVELPQLIVEKILSGCPALNSLALRDCWGFTCLEINSQNLYELLVHDSEEYESEPFLQISAPYLKSLDILLNPVQRMLQLKDISSLVIADFSFCGYILDFSFCGYILDSTSEDVQSNTKDFFQKIQHVKELNLERDPLMVLAVLLLDGWQLPKYRVRCLTINTLTDDKENISGILGLLESCPYLETLILNSFDPYGDSDTWVPPSRGDLGCNLLHLKTVKIVCLADPSLGGEPMLTLARILLKRATVLEEMEIEINIENTSDFVKMRKTLLAYPRSSPNAVIDCW